jgi:hypothetical protein
VSELLDFEKDGDLLFVAADGKKPERAEGQARSGAAALRLAKGTKRLTVKLSALLSGREFPGSWTLAGLYFYSAEKVDVTAGIESGASLRTWRKLTVPGGKWTAVMVDVAGVKQLLAGKNDLRLVLEFASPLAGEAWCDDVTLADNRQSLVGLDEGIGAEHWSIRREGFNWIIERPTRFRIMLPTEELIGGWRVEEANRIRACFQSEGETKRLTVYCDGRSYWDGAFKTMAAMDGGAAYEGQQRKPATVGVPEEQGRVERNSPGDLNHDGYDEGRGAYEVVAAGRQLAVTLMPRGDGVLQPVIEIKGLPPGDVRATVEGTLAGDILRLADGRVLLMLSGWIQRETVVNVRVR